MKKLVILFVIAFLLAFCKKNESADPYIGTFNIQFEAGTNSLFFVNNGGNPGITSTTAGEWKIENDGKGRYTLTPINDQSRILSSANGTYVSLITRPATLTNNELFTFEPTTDKNIVNFKSVASNKYIVYQYGLMSNGNICCWAIALDNKTPCNSDWSSLGAHTSNCQYDFMLIKK